MSGEIVPTNSTVIGVVLITRHSDRLGYYQDTTSYSASDTTITPLGSRQAYDSGIQLRNRYFANSSEHAIAGIDWPKVNLEEVDFIADAAEGQVIVDSAYAFAQGFFPNSTVAGSGPPLANGTTVTSPLGGYIYVPITTVEPAEDISLEGFTSCPAFTAHTSEVYASDAFKAKAAEQKDFLQSLVPYLDGRNVSLSNMYNIFDYMNVNDIHDAAFRTQLNSSGQHDYIMSNVRYLADYHEQAVFSAPDSDGIGNIAGQTILPPILSALQSIANASEPLKLQYIGVAYKPFISLFNMTEANIDGMVSYTSVVAIEVRNNTNSELTVTFNFRNGTATTNDETGSDVPFVTPALFGQSETEIPLQTFIDKLQPHAISDLATWCSRCQNTNSRGCELVSNLSNSSSSDYASITSTTGKQHVSPVVAGVIGALVGLVVAAVVFGGLGFLGGKKRKASGYAGGKRPEREESYADDAYEMDRSDGRKGGAEI